MVYLILILFVSSFLPLLISFLPHVSPSHNLFHFLLFFPPSLFSCFYYFIFFPFILSFFLSLLYLSLSLHISPSFLLSLSLCFSLCFSFSLCLCLPTCLSFSISLCLCLPSFYPLISTTIHIFLSHAIPISLSLTLCTSISFLISPPSQDI